MTYSVLTDEVGGDRRKYGREDISRNVDARARPGML